MATTHAEAGVGTYYRKLVKSYETSAANTELTVSTPTTRVRLRRVLMVLVHYTTNVTKTVTIVYNAAHGAGYDTEVATISLSTADDGTWLPDGDLVLAQGDTLDVTAPAGGAGETSAITILTEEL